MRPEDKTNDPGKRITEVWVFVSVDADGDEGVCGFLAGLAWIAMVASDDRRRLLLADMARQMVARQPGLRIECRRFGDGVVTEVFGPAE